VTLVERGSALAAGCSAGNAGLICPSHSAPLATPAALWQGVRWLGRPDSPFSLRPRPAVLPWIARFVAACTPERARASAKVIRELAIASQALHAELSTSGLDTGFARQGTLNVYETDSGFATARKEAAEAARDGLRPQVLEGARAREVEPALALTPAGAVYYPDDAHCDPLRFVQAVGAAAEDAGARLLTGVEAIGLRRSDGRLEAVSTTRGDLRAGAVVLAAGAWTPGLAHDVGVAVPVEGGKGYHVDLESGHGDPRVPIWLQESRVIATPLAGRIRLAGTLELAGLDLRVDRRRVDAVLRAGLRGVACLAGRRTVEVWRGLRPCSPDGLPIVGPVDGVDGLVLATGHGMMGLALAPVTGLLVAQLLTGQPPTQDLTPLSPGRFRSIIGS
jgi:D-amino-acid dehydrogenase